MKPLASPVAEYRLMGYLQVAAGVVLGVIAIVTEGPLVAMVTLGLEAVIFGG